MSADIRLIRIFLTGFVFFGTGFSFAETNEETLTLAVKRGLDRVKTAGSSWVENKTCFSCHHQTLPMLSLAESSLAGLPTDSDWMKEQADRTHDYFEKRAETMVEGGHVPGGAATVGFGLWALRLDSRQPDETTAAMVSYLLQIQGVQRLDDPKSGKPVKPVEGPWIASCRRPPLQSSKIGDTVLVLWGMEHYATDAQRPSLAAAKVKAIHWLSREKLRDQQDRLWRFWGLHHLGGGEEAKAAIFDDILRAQRADGGWSQSDADTESDAYTTGQTVYMLCRTGMDPGDPVARRATDYLVKCQLPDGSWHVKSIVEYKAQPYFENGDPHGEDQFISAAAGAWAVAGLVQGLIRNSE